MLVLSRQRDESIMIQVGRYLVEVVVVDIRGDKVRLGFKAPPQVPIFRTEVLKEDEAPRLSRRGASGFASPRREDGMLVLSRKRDETVRIADNVFVTVVDIRGDKTRLGIKAPDAVGIDRREVYDAKQKDHEHTA